MSVDEMLKLPYAQRRMIVVTDRAPAAPSGIDWSKLARRAARTALSAVSSVAGIAVEVFLEVRERMREAGEEITAVPWTETEALRVPVGHPRKNVIYIGHPVEPPIYVPVADFHRFLFEHKVAEAQRMIRCLGVPPVRRPPVYDLPSLARGRVGHVRCLRIRSAGLTCAAGANSG